MLSIQIGCHVDYQNTNMKETDFGVGLVSTSSGLMCCAPPMAYCSPNALFSGCHLRPCPKLRVGLIRYNLEGFRSRGEWHACNAHIRERHCLCAHSGRAGAHGQYTVCGFCFSCGIGTNTRSRKGGPAAKLLAYSVTGSLLPFAAGQLPECTTGVTYQSGGRVGSNCFCQLTNVLKRL